MQNQSIVILDFGAQYTQLIARRIREQNVFSVVLPCNAKLDEIKSYGPVGHHSFWRALVGVRQRCAARGCARLRLGVPVLGICYGLQFMVHTLGGKVRPGGEARIRARGSGCDLGSRCCFRAWPKKLAVWMSHGDEALELPPGFELMAKTHYAVAGIQNVAQEMVCGAVPSRSAPHAARHADSKELCFSDLRGEADMDCRSTSSTRPWSRSRRRWAAGRAICALSGGVDSSVAAVLVDRAMRDAKGKSRLTCVFVNNGVLRKNEFEKVQKTLRDKLGLHLDAVDATDRFLRKLERRQRSGEEAQDHRQ